MKISFVLPVLFLCSMASAQGKYRPGQYPINQNPNDYTIDFHVSATHFRQCATVGLKAPCGEGVYVDAILNGKKVELFGGVDKHQALPYRTRRLSRHDPEKAPCWYCRGSFPTLLRAFTG